MPKNITLDELAAMVARGFEHIQKDTNDKFEEMRKSIDSRFEEMQKNMDTRFEEMQKHMDTRFDEVSKRLTNIEQGQKNHEFRIKQLENAHV